MPFVHSLYAVKYLWFCELNGLSNGLNLAQALWLFSYTPSIGVVISQCIDIGLSYMSDTQLKESESYYTESANGANSQSHSSTGQTYFVVIVRWLKGRVYTVQTTAPPNMDLPPSQDSRLDPQPGYTCHMTKWSRLDPLDPTKVTLNEAFHRSQVILRSR